MRCVTLLLVIAEAAFPLAVGYHVDPVQASWCRWTGHRVPDNSVSETVTCCWDSLKRVELFAETRNNEGAWRVGVWLDGNEVMWSTGASAHNKNWVRFESWNTHVAYAKGRKYEFRFTRSGSDSFQYYYDSRNPYRYGELIDPNEQSMPITPDLAMRVYGWMKPIDSTWLSVQIHMNTARLDSALGLAHALGIRCLGDDLGHWNAWDVDSAGVRRRCSTYTAMGFEVRGMLAYGNPNEGTIASAPPGIPKNLIRAYPPRNLFAPLTDDTNYWAGYCRGIMNGLYTVKYWAVWGEPNAGWNWDDPDVAYYHGGGGASDPIDTPRERCSLYVRMCYIAKQTALGLGHNQKVVGGYVWRLLMGGTDPSGDTVVATGKSWLRHMFDLAEDPSYGGAENCFDVVGVDPYMDQVVWGDDRLWFDQGKFEADLDTARTVMRAAGHADMELWVTEMGWPRWLYPGDTASTPPNPPRPLTDTQLQARNICQFLVSSQARLADPRGGYDQVNWYELTSHRGSPKDDSLTGGLGLLDTNRRQSPLPQCWAAAQAVELLEDKRCNGRVTDGDTAVDNHVRMYEFEDMDGKRTWVCWADEAANQSIDVRLPVRTNSLAAESLAYSVTTPAFSPRVRDDGWLSMTLNARPVFISEKTAPQRPDLRVDSVQFVPADEVVRAWATNHGSRATPVRSGSRVPYPTLAVLRADGDSLEQQARATSIAVGQQAEFTFDLGQNQLPDTVLISVNVNPDQTYVELGTDDNTGYTLAIKP